jgi:hypothetical protein
MDRVPVRAGRLAVAVVSLLLASATAAGAAANGHGGALSGTWAGVLTGSAGKEHIVIVVNAAENAGTWSVSATCHGRLTLDSVSDGYHHYRRRPAAGSSCAGGDVDCLMRVGAAMYDTVTPAPGDAGVSGTLRRVRRR